jgi:beta-phosphoglucomutase-like phosphatase (HAD superfamily)
MASGITSVPYSARRWVAAAGLIHGLLSLVAPIVGRAYADPARMKPHPGPILEAVRYLGAPRANCTLVGDSITDIEAARAAGVSVVGYANRPWKVNAFSGADAVVTSMQDLAESVS